MDKLEDGCYGSFKGIALIGKVLAGRCKMHYTRVAVGKGTLPEGVNPKAMDEPPDYVMDAMISSVTNPVDGECQVAAQINSANVEKGFYATWLILYAEDPDDGDIPYTALRLEDDPEWIRPSSSIVGKLAHFDIIAAVGDVDAVYASIDPDALLTLDSAKQLIAEHGRDPETHPDIRRSIADLRENIWQYIGGGVVRAERIDLTIPAAGWTEDPEGAYPFHVDVPHAKITEDAVPLLTVLPASLGAAGDCKLCPAANTLPGALRVCAKSVPAADIAASLLLLSDVKASGEVTIPAVGWVNDEDTAGEFALHVDIAVENSQEELVPMLTILPESAGTAGLCGMSPIARTMDGLLRVYSKFSPSGPVKAHLTLLGTASGGTGSGCTLPAATASTLGGVKVRRGSGLTVDNSGNLAIDAAGSGDVAGLFNGSKAQSQE